MKATAAAVIVSALAVSALPASFLLGRHIYGSVEEVTIEPVSKYAFVSREDGPDGKPQPRFHRFVDTADESYTVENNPYLWHFGAATTYATIRPGAICKVTIAGKQIPFLNMRRNIIKASCEYPK